MTHKKHEHAPDPQPENGSSAKVDDALKTETTTEAKEKPAAPKMVTLPEEELKQIKQEASEYKDKYLRTLAEADNMRKRMQKEKQELIQYAVQNVVADFLNPIDQFENALKFTQNMSEEVKHWAFGFQMILTQFKDVLANNGITAYQSEGTQFDPHLHEAVEMVETTEYPEGIVVAESLRGYKMGGKTIRAARVKVAKAPSKEKQSEQQDKK